MTKYTTTLIAVRNMEKSLKFYKELFDQDVVCDLGSNKTLTCGITLQEHFEKIVGFEESSMKFKTHNMELYFESYDFDSFLELLSEHSEVKLVHEARTFPWQQRGIRIYDPDDHIIEIGEAMECVGWRLFKEGKTVEEVVKITEHPVEFVQKWHESFSKQ